MVISRNCFLGLGPLIPVVNALRAWTRPRPSRPEDTGAGGSIVEALLRSFRRAHPAGLVGVPGWVARVPWQEASDLHRISLLAWQADFSVESYRHLRDIYPDLYDAVIARGRHQPIPLLQRAQAAAQGAAGQAPAPAQPQQPSTPSSPSSTTTVSTIKAAAPSAAVTQTAAAGDQAAAPSAAVPTRTSSESPSRPSSYPPTTAGRGRYTAAGRSSSRRKRTPPARHQPSPAPAQKASSRRPRSRTPLTAAALSAAGSRARSSSSSTPARASLSSRPLILAPANCAYPTTRWTAQGSGSSSTKTYTSGAASTTLGRPLASSTKG